MSFNLMDLLQGAVSEQAEKAIAQALGTDASVVSQASTAAVPALVGGLLQKTSTSTGASEVFGMLDQFDGSLVQDLAGAFDGGQKQTRLLEQGQGILDAIWPSSLGNIVTRIVAATELDTGMISKLLPMLTPILMSVLGKQKKSAGWDIGQFTAALAGQKKYLNGLDPQLTKSLGFTDLLSSAESSSKVDVETVLQAGNSLQRSADSAKESPSQGADVMKILLPLILLGGLAFLVWKVGFSTPTQPTNSVDTETPVKTGEMVDSSTNTLLQQSFSAINRVVSDTTDEATAREAATKIAEITKQIEKLGVSNFTGARKLYTRPVVNGLRRRLDRNLESTYEIPGVKAILQPAIDQLWDLFSSYQN